MYDETTFEEATQGSVSVLTKEDTQTEDESGKYAHIVKGSPEKTAAAIVTEAIVFGLEVEALCGYRWVPSKDPKSVPPCPKCIEIHEMYKDVYGKDFPIK
jgi:hypothetical protein